MSVVLDDNSSIHSGGSSIIDFFPNFGWPTQFPYRTSGFSVAPPPSVTDSQFRLEEGRIPSHAASSTRDETVSSSATWSVTDLLQTRGFFSRMLQKYKRKSSNYPRTILPSRRIHNNNNSSSGGEQVDRAPRPRVTDFSPVFVFALLVCALLPVLRNLYSISSAHPVSPSHNEDTVWLGSG